MIFGNLSKSFHVQYFYTLYLKSKEATEDVEDIQQTLGADDSRLTPQLKRRLVSIMQEYGSSDNAAETQRRQKMQNNDDDNDDSANTIYKQAPTQY